MNTHNEATAEVSVRKVTAEDNVKEINVIPAEVVELLLQLEAVFNNNDIGLVAEVNANGADSYVCPGCNAELRVKGHASGTRNLLDVRHEDWCELHKLRLMFDKLKKTHAVLLAE